MNLFRRDAGSLSASQGSTSDKQQEFLAALSGALPSLNRFAQAMCRDHNGCDRERAKDLVSETILKAYESFASVREPKAFQSYLFTIAVRLNRLERKRSKRWTRIASEHDMLASDGATPDANADAVHLYEALAKLPAEQREAIVMSEILGMKLVEVAEAQKATLGAVKTRVSRGRKRLAELLGVSDEEPIALPPTPPASGRGEWRERLSLRIRDEFFEGETMSEKNKTLTDLLHAARTEPAQEFVSTNDAQRLVANSIMRDVPSVMERLQTRLFSTPLRLSITVMTSAALITLATLGVRALLPSSTPQVTSSPQLAQSQYQQPHVAAVAVDSNNKDKRASRVETQVRFIPRKTPAPVALAVPAILEPVVSTVTPVEITPEQAAEIGIKFEENGDIDVFSKGDDETHVNHYGFPAIGGIRLAINRKLNTISTNGVTVYSAEPKLVTDANGKKRLFTFRGDSSYDMVSNNGHAKVRTSNRLYIAPGDTMRMMMSETADANSTDFDADSILYATNKRIMTKVVIDDDSNGIHNGDKIDFTINGPLNSVDAIPSDPNMKQRIVIRKVLKHSDTINVQNQISDSVLTSMFRSLHSADSELNAWRINHPGTDSTFLPVQKFIWNMQHGVGKAFLDYQDHPLDLNKLVPLRVINNKNPAHPNELIFWYEPTPEITSLLPAQKQSGTVRMTPNFSVSVFPNPTSGPAQITYTMKDAAHHAVFVIRNLLGQKVMDAGSSDGTSGNISLDLSKLDAGLYLLVTTTDDGEQSVERIVVNK